MQDYQENQAIQNDRLMTQGFARERLPHEGFSDEPIHVIPPQWDQHWMQDDVIPPHELWAHDDTHADTSAAAAHAIPVNLNAERAVLGALFIDPDAILKVANLLEAADFFNETNGWVYDVVLTLHERRKPIDFVTVTDALEKSGQIDQVGQGDTRGYAYITHLSTSTPTALYVKDYAEIVKQAADLRRLITGAGKIVELAYNRDNDPADVMAQAERIVFGITQGQTAQDLSPVRPVVREVVDRIDLLSRTQHSLMGVPTGFALMDEMLGGFQKSDLIILAGRPGMGKSSLGLSIAQNAAKHTNARVAIFSLEMSKEQLVQRLLAMETGIDSHRLRLGDVYEEEWPLLMEAANVISGTSLYLDDTPAASITDVRTKCRRLYAEQGLDLVLIDYMQLMSERGKDRREQVSKISSALKGLARELNIPVIALSQLNRAVESRSDKRPTLSDLSESGSIEADSDVVMFVYREDYYIQDTDRQNIADVIIAKHRHGSTGTVSLFFRKELTQFSDLTVNRKSLNEGLM